MTTRSPCLLPTTNPHTLTQTYIVWFYCKIPLEKKKETVICIPSCNKQLEPLMAEEKRNSRCY